jgi:hypothetical protein
MHGPLFASIEGELGLFVTHNSNIVEIICALLTLSFFVGDKDLFSVLKIRGPWVVFEISGESITTDVHVWVTKERDKGEEHGEGFEIRGGGGNLVGELIG